MSLYKTVPIESITGDCLYAAIIKGADLSCNVGTLREITSEVLKTNDELYDDLYREMKDYSLVDSDTTKEKILDDIVNDHSWGTSTIIHILSSLLKINVNVITYINNVEYIESFPSEYRGQLKDDIYTKKIKQSIFLLCSNVSNHNIDIMFKDVCHFDLVVRVK